MSKEKFERNLKETSRMRILARLVTLTMVRRR